MAEKLVHLIYVHGFQGNDTTFQSFPTDLQQHLAARVARLGVSVQSSIYPTYKSVKPIAFATTNFLEWLKTQPPGPVILLGHSMGGLLAADAATSPSNSKKPRRIVGVVAFDTPYLGMHPHVIVSGIASLFPKDDANKATPSEMNDTEQVNMVDANVTDDWQAYKNATNYAHSSLTVTTQASISSARSPPPSLATRTSNSSAASHTPSASIASTPTHQHPIPIVGRTLAFIDAHADDPLVRWARKHADAPLTAGKRWVVEHFQFGACMFDPSGLQERYARLVAWDGLWVNYWTQTVAQRRDGIPQKDRNGAAMQIEEAARLDNDAALLDTGIVVPAVADVPSTPVEDPPLMSPASDIASPISHTPTTATSDAKDAKQRDKSARRAEKEREKEREKVQKQAEKARKAARKEAEKREKEAARREKDAVVRPARHFIVLPTGLGKVLGGSEKWERVTIGGVEDEVAAHCGLFIPGQNLDYEGLVERVGRKVMEWCERLE